MDRPDSPGSTSWCSSTPEPSSSIDRLTLRVANLEQQVQALIEQLGIEPVGGVALDPQAADADETLALLREGKTIDAISLHRASTGAGLGEAKAHIDQLKADHGL